MAAGSSTSPNKETVTFKLPTGEEVDAIIPGGLSDADAKSFIQMKRPDLIGPPAQGAGPSKQMSSGEGPIAKNLTSFEAQASKIPGAIGSTILAKHWPIIDAQNWSELGQDIKSLNPIVSNDNGIDIGASAANLLPMVMGGRGTAVGEAIGDLPTGRIARTAVKTGAGALGDIPILRQVPKIMQNWRDTAPAEPDILADTKQAIKEGRAAKIPTRIPASQQAASTPIGQTESGISGSMPKASGRMILTPEEIAQREQLYNVAKKSAHERGMAFAGGQVPASGRKVPYVPRPNEIIEWSGKKPNQ